jgi:hypothetical protein
MNGVTGGVWRGVLTVARERMRALHMANRTGQSCLQ